MPLEPTHRTHTQKSPFFIHEWLELHAEKTPSHPAVSFQKSVMDYAKLNLLSSQITHFLLEKKIRPGDPVVVLMDRTPLLMAVMLGVFRAGGIFVPINPKYPDEKIRFIINDCQARLILTDNLQRIPVDALYQTTLIQSAIEGKGSESALPSLTSSLDPDATACIVYTSEAKDRPTGVMIRHESLMNLAEWYTSCFNITHQDKASQFASQSYDTFLCETIPFIFVGASIHIIDTSSRLMPEDFFDWTAQNKITFCHLPTLYAKVLFSYRWPDNHFLQTVLIGGERLKHYPDQIFSFDLWNIYGLTETCSVTTAVCLARSGQSMAAWRETHPLPPIGKPIINVECYVVDHKMKRVQNGQAGELLVGGMNLSSGYLNRPELTREKFIQHPFSEDPEAKVFRTGDRVCCQADGNLDFLGKMENQVKIQGYHIKLDEIESCLTAYPDISEAIVLVKKTEDGKKSLVSWLVPKIEKIRIPWQGKCLVSLNDTSYLQAITENISREGMGISGLSEDIPINHPIRINLTLPGSDDSLWLNGKLIWQNAGRAGIYLEQSAEQKKLLDKCFDYYLSTHNLMETLESASVSRNLKNVLKKRLPEHMIPEAFCLLPRLPLTFNGKVDIKSLPYSSQLHQVLTGDPIEPRTETEKKLARIWRKILHKSSINLKENFFDLGGTSILAAEFCLEVAKAFNITLPPSIFIDRPYLPIIAEFIDSMGENYTLASPLQKQIESDSVLADDISPCGIKNISFDKPKKILLTGSNGFLGLYLLKYLLQKTDATVYCIIRKSGFESLSQRIARQINQFNLSDDISLDNPRIILLPGDIAMSFFNLPMGDYKALSEEIDCIYHCGAQINTMASYNSLRASNVIGTREIIHFATSRKDKGIHYISSFSAASQKNGRGRYAEVFPNDKHEGITGGYALTKWISERLLTQVMQRGLPVHLYRLGAILGDMTSGAATTNSGLLILVKGCIQLGIAPDWREKVAVLPVDFVAKALIALSSLHPEKSQIYHIEHPTGISWVELIQWFQKKGYAIEIVSHGKWLQRLNTLDHSNALFPVLPYYLSMMVPPLTILPAMEKTQEALRKVGLQYPEINQELLEIYFNNMLQTGFLSLPGTADKFMGVKTE